MRTFDTHLIDTRNSKRASWLLMIQVGTQLPGWFTQQEWLSFLRVLLCSHWVKFGSLQTIGPEPLADYFPPAQWENVKTADPWSLSIDKSCRWYEAVYHQLFSLVDRSRLQLSEAPRCLRQILVGCSNSNTTYLQLPSRTNDCYLAINLHPALSAIIDHHQSS